jgi:hypothetical protein
VGCTVWGAGDGGAAAVVDGGVVVVDGGVAVADGGVAVADGGVAVAAGAGAGAVRGRVGAGAADGVRGCFAGARFPAVVRGAWGLGTATRGGGSP